LLSSLVFLVGASNTHLECLANSSPIYCGDEEEEEDNPSPTATTASRYYGLASHKSLMFWTAPRPCLNRTPLEDIKASLYKSCQYLALLVLSHQEGTVAAYRD